jgi:HEAT repeat protein
MMMPMPDMNSILQSLKSPLDAEREQAIQGLVRSRDVRSLAILKKMASDDESVSVRYMAKKGLFYLRKQLGQDGLPDPSQEEEAAAAREKEENEASGIPAEKLQALFASGSPAQKLRLLQGLSRRNLTSALPVLLQHDVAGEPPEVRSNMVLVVGILGGEDELRFLKTFLDDPDPRVRANTIEAMESLGTPKMYPLLIKVLSDSDNRIRANAIKALQSYGKVNCLALLEKMVGSTNVWMRDSAAYALGLIGGSESLSLLRIALEDEEPSVREKARAGLQTLADKGIPGANSALNAHEEPSKDFGLASLFEVSPEQREKLFDPSEGDPLENSDPKVRIQGIERIVAAGETWQFKKLLKAARNEKDGFVRAKMVVGLGRIGESSSVASLLSFLSDEVDRVRANAIEALAAADRESAQHHLTPMLDDPNNRVRANAIMALADFPEVDIFPHLEGMVRSDQPLMRRSAFYVITDLASKKAHALLRELIDDEEAELKDKVQEYVQMSVEEGQAWAVKLNQQRTVIRGAPLPTGNFPEFEIPPPDGEALSTSQDPSPKSTPAPTADPEPEPEPEPESEIQVEAELEELNEGLGSEPVEVATAMTLPEDAKGEEASATQAESAEAPEQSGSIDSLESEVSELESEIQTQMDKLVVKADHLKANIQNEIKRVSADNEQLQQQVAELTQQLSAAEEKIRGLVEVQDRQQVTIQKLIRILKGINTKITHLYDEG